MDLRDRLRKKTTYMIPIVFLISWLVVPILGLQDFQQKISSNGVVVYPEHELGVFFVDSSDWVIPDEASWVVATRPGYVKPREDISLILNWYSLHPPKPIETEAEIKEVEEGLKGVPTENFWGIIFICEEHYRTEVVFNDDVDTTWFGERLVGYPLYSAENPDATRDDWKDEMYLRMIHGFYNYFHAKTNVGVTIHPGLVIPNYKNLGGKGIPQFFGEPAMAFIREYYDFVFLYPYTRNLEDFLQYNKEFYTVVDQLFKKQRKFWILTRIWDEPRPYGNVEDWEREAIALEMKNCLDRNMVITCYYWNNPPFEETWALMLKAVKLYETEAPYYEEYVYGENLLTGYVGNTYGWLEVLG